MRCAGALSFLGGKSEESEASETSEVSEVSGRVGGSEESAGFGGAEMGCLAGCPCRAGIV